jgi:hypothetical protein
MSSEDRRRAREEAKNRVREAQDKLHALGGSRADRRSYLRLREQALLLADAAEDVDRHIMDSGLAFKRERMRWFVGTVRDVVRKEDGR